MHFLVNVDTDNGTYTCVAYASSEYYAEKKAMAHYRNDGEEVYHAAAEMFNSFEHGDLNDYDIIT